MLIGFVLWCVFHVLFLVFGLGRANYALILLFYGIRGLAYPLFLYSFIVAIIHNVRSDSSSSALGWFWAVYSVGIGVFGSYIPSFYHSPHWRNGHPVAGAALLRHRRHYCAGVDGVIPKRRAICRT
ncbi:ribitol/Xylitol/Arabitol transporter, MFS superfamily [Klebsiella pneumoniae subsp. ozaenae]|uniref:Ribitol/Xylitol/Arabitol transporter, MFS superfamily n=1 Tax=Klebsiella pneumoniae subsp. ozaenae TaxID=574 RepID=A0A378A0C8_KLEPO|nr:ribitol/Xylitol/Arabitol transporter, MFS superfamily [Klebsiella pneumoniae subsp. ozaenae]